MKMTIAGLYGIAPVDEVMQRTLNSLPSAPEEGLRSGSDGPLGRLDPGLFARSIEDESQRFLLCALIDQIPDFLFVKDAESRFVIANRAVAQAYGRNPSDLVGKTDHDLHPLERADAFLAREREVIRTGSPILNMEESFPDVDGVPRSYSTTKVPLRNALGRVIGLIGIARDVTDRTKAESFAQHQSLILEMIAKNASLQTVLSEIIGLIESQFTGVTGSVLLLEAATGRLRHGAAPGLPKAYCQAIDGVVIGPKAGSCGTAAFRRERVVVNDIRTDPLWEGYVGLADANGLRSCWSTPIVAHDGSVLGTFAIYSGRVRTPASGETRFIETATRLAGIAIERHQSEQRLLHMAHYDPLTELPNRALCLGRLRAAVNEHRSEGRNFALHYIDLDGFKTVNDTLGHHVGDHLLKLVGERLRETVTDDHTVARLGGDEFAVIQILRTAEPCQESAALADNILAALRLPYEIDKHRIAAGASIGIAVAGEEDAEPDVMLRDADLALYKAKAENTGGIRFFEPEMNRLAQTRRNLEADLQRALDADEFELFYQPQIDITSDRICGFEALLRWNHPASGMVPPMDFVGVAEEIGLIVPIGAWVLLQACRQAARWPASVNIAVNLSPVQFQHPGLLSAVVAALSESGLSPERLELEITESVLLGDNETNLALLHQFRTLGVQISLDDFGTGYSSLSYLRSFPFTKLKIDRSFVKDLEENRGCLAIVRAASRLASDLGMRSIAEGVETTQQLERLRIEGCDEVQGYLFSRPVPADVATRMVDRGCPERNAA